MQERHSGDGKVTGHGKTRTLASLGLQQRAHNASTVAYNNRHCVPSLCVERQCENEGELLRQNNISLIELRGSTPMSRRSSAQGGLQASGASRSLRSTHVQISSIGHRVRVGGPFRHWTRRVDLPSFIQIELLRHGRGGVLFSFTSSFGNLVG